MKSWIKKIAFGAVGLSALIYSCSKNDDFWSSMIPESENEATSAQIQGYVFTPALLQASAENISRLKVPAGFTVNKFADQLYRPRILVVNSSGVVYVSDRDAGTVMMLKDMNGDGIAEVKQVVAKLKDAHGLAIFNSRLYITAIKEIYAAEMNSDGTLGELQMVVGGLPDAGQHPNRTLSFGPDGKMYISIGSTCNSCAERNELNATMVQGNPDGSNRVIFSKGLRNTIGFGWHPQTGEMWGMDHGIDWLGDDEQKEEVNQIKQGANYGWPFIYGEGKYNPSDRPEGNLTYQQYLSITTLPVLTYDAHAAPMQMAFYTGTTFPAEYQNDAFVAMRGSWNRSNPSGYKVVRVHFENNKPVRIDDFLTGFLVDNKAHFGRLVGVTVHTDGSLLVSDDTNGIIYRVAHN